MLTGSKMGKNGLQYSLWFTQQEHLLGFMKGILSWVSANDQTYLAPDKYLYCQRELLAADSFNESGDNLASGYLDIKTDH